MTHHPYLKIVLRNTCTLFNAVNLILAAMVAFTGSYKNMLFIVIAIANTLISIINEVRATHIVNQLRLIAEQKPTVERDGQSLQISPEEVKVGDTLVLSLGDQVLYDSVVKEGQLEVNESFVTGEQDSIAKHPGDSLISGSFVVSGLAKATVTHVGAENSLEKLEAAAHAIKPEKSQLFTLMNNIVRYISYALIPIGALLLWARFRTEPDSATAITSTVAALINMIPEGLILLTSSVLALATIRLSRQKVLVQDLYSVETLARVDTICLDKTGTLTTGRMRVHDYTTLEKSFLSTLASILSHQMGENATNTALKAKFLKKPSPREIKGITEVIPFSSARKYSGLKTKDATYLLGAVEFITKDQDIINQVNSVSENYRVLAVVKHSSPVAQESDASREFGAWAGEDERRPPVATGRADAARETSDPAPLATGASDPSLENTSSASLITDGREEACLERPDSAPLATGASDAARETSDLALHATASRDVLLGYVRLTDEIRQDAAEIIKYFQTNNIDIKVISGDNLSTVTTIASQVGIDHLAPIDLSQQKRKNYAHLAKHYNVFTRVTPVEKQKLVKALQKQDRTVAMTGDGVNDILAMKEADCSIAIGAGSDAARRSAKLVLLGAGFEAVPSIIAEGRRSINNLERSTSLFLTKTVYASILAVLFTILPLSYPFTPIEMSLLNTACIGLPGLILALEPNTARIKNQFITNIRIYSVPTGLTVAITMVALSVAAHFLSLAHAELTTISVLVTFTIDLVLIYQISRPLNLLRGSLLAFLIVVMLAAFLLPFARSFFEFAPLSAPAIITTLSLIAFALALLALLRFLFARQQTTRRRAP